MASTADPCKQRSSVFDSVNIFVITGIIIFIIITIIFLGYYIYIDKGMVIINLDASNTKQLATDLFFNKLESIGKMSLALLGALWAIVIYKESKIKIKTSSQRRLFILTNLFLLGSFASYFLGYDFLVARIFYHSTIDLGAPIVGFWRLMQLVYFLTGLVWFVITVYFCRENKIK